jgi:serine/threonine protein kinase
VTPNTAPSLSSDELLLHVLGRSIGREKAERLHTEWRQQRAAGESFADHLVGQGVLNRVGARAIEQACAGRLDMQDVRQVIDAAAMRRAAQGLAERPSAEMELSWHRPVGGRIGRYIIKGLLGRGNFGPVYLSTHPTLRVPVAIKLVSPEAVDRDALRAEARRQALVNHPNVVRVWDYEDGEEPFLVTEYVSGENLRERLSVGPLDRREGFTLIVQAALALRAALRAGVTHHDVKPSNLLLTPENGYKLCDFGLARCRRLLVRAVPQAATCPRRAAGTWTYTAPERFEGVGDHRSDIYSLGMTAYHALAGRPAVIGSGPDDLMLLHKRGDFEPLHRAAPGIGWDASDLVGRMIATDPERRFPSYEDLIASAETAFGFRLEHY